MPNNSGRLRTQEAAEAEVEEFKQELGPFVVAAETTRMAMIFTDAKQSQQPIIFANDSFLALTGYERNELLGEDFQSVLATNCKAQALGQLKAAFEGAWDGDPELYLRRNDGSTVPTSVFISPVRDERGDIQQYFVSFVNLTSQTQEQEHLRFR